MISPCMKEREEKQNEIAPWDLQQKKSKENKFYSSHFQLLENKVILFTKENSGCAQNQKSLSKCLGSIHYVQESKV